MKITTVQKSSKKNNIFSVFVDDSYSFSITEEDYMKLNLYEEQDITEAEITKIRDIANKGRAKSSAISYLSAKLRSQKEVYDRLIKEGFNVLTVEAVISELKSMGYLNDRLYVQKYLYDRSKLKPKSKKMLRYELMKIGIGTDIIDDVMQDWVIDDETLAENLIKKKFGKYDMKDEKILKRMFYFLRHRGFSYDVIKKIIMKYGDYKL